MNGGVSIHVVDIASGRVAQGMAVSIGAVGQAPMLEGHVDERGLLPQLDELNERFAVGVYEVRLQVAAFYRARGTALPEKPFMDELIYRFGIGDTREHFHLPFKLTAWGVSCFRGGA